MWVKICGMTTPAAVAAALEAGADAIGFVFAASVRRVTPHSANELALPARGRVPCVAVIRQATQQEFDSILADFAPDVLQAELSDLARLALPRELGVLAVVRAGREPPDPPPARVLFEGPVSGAGVPCDWTSARAFAQKTELVLAGGLNVHNVAAAIRTVRPFGVDVSSGVEEQPGIKSALAIARFVQAAREESQV
jgi:phosphoribosylanthranilate isomerase